MNCTVDHILQEFNTLFLTRFRTYKIASPPQTKMTSKDDIKGMVSSKLLRPCLVWAQQQLLPPPEPLASQLLLQLDLPQTLRDLSHILGGHAFSCNEAAATLFTPAPTHTVEGDV
jgi:hypothetical protein